MENVKYRGWWWGKRGVLFSALVKGWKSEKYPKNISAGHK